MGDFVSGKTAGHERFEKSGNSRADIFVGATLDAKQYQCRDKNNNLSCLIKCANGLIGFDYLTR